MTEIDIFLFYIAVVTDLLLLILNQRDKSWYFVLFIAGENDDAKGILNFNVYAYCRRNEEEEKYNLKFLILKLLK